ncbi:MAG: ATP-binding cassette domain-containing protein, partial [Planctomycetota bacterium]
MRGVHKAFGATRALVGADLDLARGEVLALIGENGAGKSTLMKVLAGALLPDGGSMTLEGRPYRPAGPLEARRAGVAMIYQELNIAPHLTVAENILLGTEPHTAGWLHRRAPRERVVAALAHLKRPDIHPDAPAGSLPPAARQLVEIARALVQDARVIVMDEPTSSLGAADIEHLFTVIEGLCAAGIGVVYISHFLEEVLRVADRYAVLRDGALVETG